MKTNEKGRKAEEKREKREDKKLLTKLSTLLRPTREWIATIEFKGEEGRIYPFGVALMIYKVPEGHRLLLKNVKCSATSEFGGLPSNAWHKIRIVSTPHGLLCEEPFLRYADVKFDPPQVINQNQNLYVYIHNKSSEFIESTVNITGILENVAVIKLISIAKFIIPFISLLISIAMLGSTISITGILERFFTKLISIAKLIFT